MDWFERTSVGKKRKEESSNKLAAAASLLQLHVSQPGNGTDYCPHTGTCSMTDLTMKDLEQAETAQQNLLVQLKNEKETLLSECQALRVECQSLMLECEELKKQNYTKAYFQDNNAKVKYYTTLKH